MRFPTPAVWLKTMLSVYRTPVWRFLSVSEICRINMTTSSTRIIIIDKEGRIKREEMLSCARRKEKKDERE